MGSKTHRALGALGLVAALALSGCAFVERVDVKSDGSLPSGPASAGVLSADGRYEAFFTCLPLVPDDHGQCDTYLRDVRDDTTERVSVSAAGGDTDGSSTPLAISADGRYVLLQSLATNLVPGGTPPDDTGQLFVRDRSAGTTTLVVVTTDGKVPNSPPGRADLSADGRFVVFDTAATNVAPGASASRQDVYVRDLVNGTTTRVSLSSDGVVATGDSQAGGISADGNLVVFESTADNLGGTPFFNHVYVRNRSAGTTSQVDVPLSGASNGGAIPADHGISTSGRYVLFNAWADDLTDDDPVGTTDVYVHDLQTGTTSMVYSPSGVPAAGDKVPLLALNPVGISDDGRYVVINGLRTGDIMHLTDFQVYVLDRTEGRITLVRAPGGVPFTRPARSASLSADGRYLSFAVDDPRLSGSFIRSTSAPTITGVSPAVLTPGAAVDLQITGSHFVTGTTFAFGDGIAVGPVTVADEQHATVHVTVAPGAAPGPRSVLVIAPGTGAGPGSGGLEIFPNLVTVGS